MNHSKLDRRHKGHGHLKYYADFHKNEHDLFCNIRDWCWIQWGPSSELEFWTPGRNACWCWITDEWRMRIYFASDKEYQWFILKWG